MSFNISVIHGFQFSLCGSWNHPYYNTKFDYNELIRLFIESLRDNLRVQIECAKNHPATYKDTLMA